jgi:diacylglycerol kinase (ATP)
MGSRLCACDVSTNTPRSLHNIWRRIGYLWGMLQNSTTASHFSLDGRLKSFIYAGRGIRTMFATQPNARAHALATLLVVTSGLLLRVSRLDWLALIIAIVSVWTAEAVNTAFEFLCDIVSPEFHPAVEKAKDVAAGAVLICACGAVVTGGVVFGVPLIALVF